MIDVGRDLYMAYEDGFKNGVLKLSEKMKERLHKYLFTYEANQWCEEIDEVVKELTEVKDDD